VRQPYLAELPIAPRGQQLEGCQGWFTARVNTCGELDDALETAEQAGGAAYIDVVTDVYEAPPLYKKLHENVKSFYNVR
jgi:indolepyruvate decarboxylase